MLSGACCVGGELDASQGQQDKEIEKFMEEENRAKSNEIRLLLLGAGESGKSTMARQLKILHSGGFTQEERASYKIAIHQNIWDSIATIYQASQTFAINIKKKDNRLFAMQFLEPFPGDIPANLVEGIEAFWNDSGTRKLIKRRNEFQLIDSTEYYISNVRRILDPGYQPSEQDVLRVRIQTTGIIETSFMVDAKKFIMVDVGGQRSERKKWVHCFEDVLGVLFCVGISEFDKNLYEDNQTNRMHEARKLFHEICQSKWFTQTAMILFLNKDDLFREKIAAGKSIVACYPDFPGPNTYEASIKFIESKFKAVVNPTTGKPREIYVHVTCATDTTSVKAVFQAVTNFIANAQFSQMGML